MSPTPSTPVLKNAPSTCNTLMLWANHLKETSNKIDAGIMPPPSTTLPLNIRRTSLTGLMSCGISDQTSPPILKSEIIDENSQNSLLSGNGDNSMDYCNENSMDCNTSVRMMPTSALDMMTNPFPPPPPPPAALMGMQSTSPINVVDLRVKQEDDLPPIPDLGNPNLSEESAQLIAASGSGSSFIEPFGRSKLNDLKVQVNDVPMFNAQPADVMLGPNLALSSLNTDQHMQQAIGQSSAVFGQQTMMPETATTNTNINHMLSFPNVPQTIASNCLTSSPTNPSPLSADVMLNSQSLSTINTSPNSASGSSSSIESDIIMNSAISPTMICSNNPVADSANLITSPVSIGSDNQMLTSPPQQASGALLNNLIQPMSINQQSDAVMKNMILNAAAEILSSEPNSITAETTTNALMSLNTAEQAQPTTPQHGSPPSITNILTHSESTSSVVVLAGNNKLIQNGKFTFEEDRPFHILFTIWNKYKFLFRPNSCCCGCCTKCIRHYSKSSGKCRCTILCESSNC